MLAIGTASTTTSCDSDCRKRRATCETICHQRYLREPEGAPSKVGAYAMHVSSVSIDGADRTMKSTAWRAKPQSICRARSESER